MKKKEIIKRQGLRVTINQLRKLTNELENEIKELDKDLGFETDYNRIFQINIINETGLSDNWEIEE